jgi:hypothetical protein
MNPSLSRVCCACTLVAFAIVALLRWIKHPAHALLNYFWVSVMTLQYLDSSKTDPKCNEAGSNVPGPSGLSGRSPDGYLLN